MEAEWRRNPKGRKIHRDLQNAGFKLLDDNSGGYQKKDFLCE